MHTVDQGELRLVDGRPLDLDDTSPRNKTRLAAVASHFIDLQASTLRPWGSWSGVTWRSTASWLRGDAGRFVTGWPLDTLDDYVWVRARVLRAGGAEQTNVPRWVLHGHFPAAPTWPARDQPPCQWDARSFESLQPPPRAPEHLWTSEDPWLLGMQERAREQNLRLCLYPIGWSADDFNRCRFGAIRGVARKGHYAWPLQLDVADPPVWTLSVTAGKDDERDVSDALVASLEGAPHCEFVSSQLVEVPIDDPRPVDNAEVFVFGRRKMVAEPVLVAMVPRLHVVDMPQQMTATGRKQPGSLCGHRYTLQHRTEFADVTRAGVRPVLHHSRLYTTENQRWVLPHLRRWHATSGWKGLTDDWRKMLGLASLRRPLFGHLPAWVMVVTEAAHLLLMGFLSRCCEYLLLYMQSVDPHLALFEHLARHLPWPSLCGGNAYWRALRLAEKQKAAGTWKLWITIITVLRLGYELPAHMVAQVAVLEHCVVIIGKAFFVKTPAESHELLLQFRRAWGPLRRLFDEDATMSPTFLQVPMLFEVHLYLCTDMAQLLGLRGENKHQELLAGWWRPAAGYPRVPAPARAAGAALPPANAAPAAWRGGRLARADPPRSPRNEARRRRPMARAPPRA